LPLLKFQPSYIDRPGSVLNEKGAGGLDANADTVDIRRNPCKSMRSTSRGLQIRQKLFIKYCTVL